MEWVTYRLVIWSRLQVMVSRLNSVVGVSDKCSSEKSGTSTTWDADRDEAQAIASATTNCKSTCLLCSKTENNLINQHKLWIYLLLTLADSNKLLRTTFMWGNCLSPRGSKPKAVAAFSFTYGMGDSQSQGKYSRITNAHLPISMTMKMTGQHLHYV